MDNMRINLNDPKEFTIENFRKLIASEDDSASTQICVSTDGYLFLSREIGCENLSNILFRLESFCESCGNVGIEASKDDIWITRLFNAVKENWSNHNIGYIDDF
jgi:hypothetical protein